ncbi:MAG: PilZ domain-containing protein [Oscillospiraceae bacterium]|nr:PilZ domain-containing protein [Oscillospiraceae bacterium]MCL2278013.1 PilZ domain-containing protein [Oscillospiraceae bacterium]
MKLMHLVKGTKLLIFEDKPAEEAGDGHEATVRYHESERHIVVACPWLYSIYDKLNPDLKFNVSFDQGAVVHSFLAVVQARLRSGDQVVLRQLTEIVTTERRQFERDEMRIKVSIYGLPESMISTRVYYSMLDSAPEFSDISYDISSGGLCVITNNILDSKYDPYYILEFSLTSRDSFFMPAKLVRRSNYPHTKLGKYDYGFQFIYDAVPEEKGRLTSAILNRKVRGY